MCIISDICPDVAKPNVSQDLLQCLVFVTFIKFLGIYYLMPGLYSAPAVQMIIKCFVAIFLTNENL